ncbi:MAG: hypothetical protein L3J34_02510 [Flavobacteriaceae bacterium]|nr:hypothetical protein [Flavobacteriaceae bacterium]
MIQNIPSVDLYPNHTAFRFFDSFFLPLNALKNKTVTKAMVEFFAFLKKKITFGKTPENLNGLGISNFLFNDKLRKEEFIQDIGKTYEEIGFIVLKGPFLGDNSNKS